MGSANTVYAALAAFAVSVVLLLAAAAGVFTGDGSIVRVAAPVGLAGLAAALLGVKWLGTVLEAETAD